MPYANKEKQAEYYRKYFKKNRAKVDAYKREWNQKNRPRLAEQQRARIAKDPDKYKAYFRNRHIMKTYGISYEQYEKMASDQGGVCAICGRLPNGENHVEQRLLIDHCHKTGKVRGLLCNNCNSGIGILGDSIKNLESAVEYLKKYSKEA